MGVDIYVGRLVPYFMGDWEPESVDRYIHDGESARAVLIKSNRRFWDRSVVKSTPEAVEATQEWMRYLSEGLGLPEALDWRESDACDYYTLPLGWHCYEGLLLWAAYEESGDTPPAYVPDDSFKDSVLQLAQGNVDSRYRSFLNNTEIWLPGDYDLTFRTSDPTGKKTDFSFTELLLRQLEDLNARTWQAELDSIIQWSESPPEKGAPLEDCAQFGFAVLYRLAVTALKHRLPMILDY